MRTRRLMLATTLAVAVWASVSTGHAGKSLAIGEHIAAPAAAVQVPVTMADAAGVAAASFIVNFDPDLLTLMNVATGNVPATTASWWCSETTQDDGSRRRPNEQSNTQQINAQLIL